MSNLEQRFDTLIDLLATNGGAAKGPVLENTAVTPYRTNNTAVTAEPTVQNPPSYFTPAQTPTTSERGDTYPYDPVEAGIISSESASSLLKTYRSWDVSFPFVILKEDVTVDDLRRQKPFLFLAIMTVTTYATPSRQRALLEKLKSQIAHRVIEKSEKSLEIIQGLLIYVAWYIFFFKQQSNQLSIILQICVAMVFDIQLSKGPCQKRTPDSSGQREAVKGGRTAAEMRAYLGTYYFTVAYVLPNLAKTSVPLNLPELPTPGENLAQ